MNKRGGAVVGGGGEEPSGNKPDSGDKKKSDGQLSLYVLILNYYASSTKTW